VSRIGTFAAMSAFLPSLNMLSLFGVVLRDRHRRR
jgi:multidrug efflux pump subunit AcrB